MSDISAWLGDDVIPKEATLEEELKNCFGDWDGDFDVDIEQESSHHGWDYFSVIIGHRTLGEDYSFSARVNDNGDCEMDYCDDCWQDIDKGNVFAWMWFETAKRKPTDEREPPTCGENGDW